MPWRALMKRDAESNMSNVAADLPILLVRSPRPGAGPQTTVNRDTMRHL